MSRDCYGPDPARQLLSGLRRTVAKVPYFRAWDWPGQVWKTPRPTPGDGMTHRNKNTELFEVEPVGSVLCDLSLAKFPVMSVASTEMPPRMLP